MGLVEHLRFYDSGGYWSSGGGSSIDLRGASAAGRQKFRRVRSSSVRRPLRLYHSFDQVV